MNWICKHLGHKYAPRYPVTEKQRNYDGHITAGGKTSIELAKPLINKQYVCDICTRCGDIKHEKL